MVSLLTLALTFSVAPWSDPVPRAQGATQKRGFAIPRSAPPFPKPAPAPHAGHKVLPHAGHKIEHKPVLTKLAQLKAREMEIWKGLLAKKTASGFYNLGALRLEIANEQKRLNLVTPAQYRKFLQQKAIAPLKLNFRPWGRKSTGADGTTYDRKSWTLVGKIQDAIKATVKQPPMPKGQKLFKGRATHYGGEKIYGNEPYPEFHGKPTAVGDTFCMFGQTAAFNRCPLNSWLRVRNPRTGRFVDVRVNDTGPFEAFGVLIDMSRGTYRLLGLQDGDKVLIRRIDSSQVVSEPQLCTGRGHAPRSQEHLDERHFAAPGSWR